jgi:hypothetical protein
VRGSPAFDPRREVDNRIEHRHDLSQRGGNLMPRPCDSIIAVGDYWIIRFRE